MITIHTKIKRIDDKLLSSSLGKEVIMMDIETGDYLSLNEVSAKIWEMVETPVVVHQICKNLKDVFMVDRAVCEEQTLDFLQQLHQEGLLEIQ